jgi:hypothetical protein
MSREKKKIKEMKKGHEESAAATSLTIRLIQKKKKLQLYSTEKRKTAKPTANHTWSSPMQYRERERGIDERKTREGKE